MPYRVNCPACKASYLVPDQTLGTKVKCQKCSLVFAVGSAQQPTPAAPTPPKPAAPKAAEGGRTTTKPPTRPPGKSPPRRSAVQTPPAPPAQPALRKKTPLLILGLLAAVLLVLGGAATGVIVAGIYFFKSRPETPVAQNVRQTAGAEEAPSSKPAAPPNRGETEKANAETAIPPKPNTPSAPERTEKPSSSQSPELPEKPSPAPTRTPAASTPPSPPPPTPAPAAVQVAPLRIKFPVPRLAKYEPDSKRWVYSHQHNNNNGVFYVDVLPPGAPTNREGYAAKLLEKDFQEPGQQFTEITEKGDLPDGFFIKGVVKHQARPRPEFGFVIVRKINGAFLRCRNGTVDRRPVSDDELRQTMLDVFKQVTIRTTTLIPLPPPSGAVLLPDNATLVVAIAETANLIYFDTIAEREVKRVEVDFQPGELIVQGDTIFAAAKGSALIYALDAATGKATKEYNLGGDGIVHLACQPRKGLIYASTTKFGVVSLDPVSGAVHTPKAAGQFLAVSPDGKYLYTGVQPPDLDEIEIIRRRDGSIHIFSDMWGPRAFLTKYAVDGSDLRFVTCQNNAAVNGRWMHLTPDGKRILMVGGGGWRPPKEGGTGGGYITAIFSADNLNTKLQPIPFSGLNTIFHPVLNLGVTNNYGLYLTVFNGKSLVKRTDINISFQREDRPSLLMFGGKGRKLILWNGNNIQTEQGLHFLPLPLKPEEEAALDKAPKQPAPAGELKPAAPAEAASSETQQQKNSPASPDAEASKALLPDLGFVPGKEVLFLSVQPAELWKDPALAPLRKLAETNKMIVAGLARLKQSAGLDPGDIQRAVIIFWGKKNSPNSVALTTTVKPFDRPRVLRMIGEGQREEQVSGKTVIGSPKSEFALHLLNEHTFLYGRAPEVRKLLERPAAATRDVRWNAILRSAPRHALVLGVQRDIFSEDPKKEIPPPLKILNPLLDAQTAVATLDASKELRLSMRLLFNSEEEAKRGERAARQGLNAANVFLTQFAAPFKKSAPGSLPPPLAKLVAGVDDAEAALKKAVIQTKNNVLSCDLVLESDKWPEALAGGLELFLTSPSKVGPPPGSKKPGPSRN
jgi:predicted Zn finger-like uncharacterized protein